MARQHHQIQIRLQTWTAALIGHLNDETLDCLDEGWRQLYGEGGLKTHIESKE